MGSDVKLFLELLPTDAFFGRNGFDVALMTAGDRVGEKHGERVKLEAYSWQSQTIRSLPKRHECNAIICLIIHS